MPDPPAFIAGVGISPWTWPRGSLPSLRTKSAVQQLAISAGTKALLDAGVSYDDVDHAVGCGDLKGDHDVFYTFGKTGIPIHEVHNDSGLYTATHFIQTGDAHCVLLIGLDQNAAVAFVIASDAFMWRHPYLKDSSVLVRGCALGTPMKGSPPLKKIAEEAFRKAGVNASDIQIAESNAKEALDDLNIGRNVKTWSSASSLSGLVEIVWLLRGWTPRDSPTKLQNCLQCSLAPNGTATTTILSRADGEAAPAYKDVEHKNDGRDRFCYNPALQTKDIDVEDWESVKARPEYSDDRAVDKVRFGRRGGDRAALSRL